MKTGSKIAIVVAVVLVLLLCCCTGSALGWYFVMGPGSYQTAQANKLIDTANKKYKSVNDSAAEIESQSESLGNDLNSKSDQAAIENFQDELTKMESKSQEMIDDLDSADATLAKAGKLRLPTWQQNYISLLLKRDKAAKTGLDEVQKSFAEIRKLVGSISYVIDAVNRMGAASETMQQISEAMSGGDYTGALASISAADSSLAAAETALNTANETIKAQDLTDMINLNTKYRELLALMSQFIQAAQASDINRMTALEPQVTDKLNQTQAAADSLGVAGDFDSWFEKQFKGYEKLFKESFDTANKYDKEATSLLNANTGKV